MTIKNCIGIIVINISHNSENNDHTKICIEYGKGCREFKLITKIKRHKKINVLNYYEKDIKVNRLIKEKAYVNNQEIIMKVKV